MKKLYYDNLYYALVMATNYGVKFQQQETDGKSFIDANIPNSNEDYCEFSMSEGNATEGAGLYVHPDSYPVFEPQLWDRIDSFEVDGIGCEHICVSVVVPDDTYKDLQKDEPDNFPDYVVLADAKVLLQLPQYKIIQRNGRPFIMPEVKE